MCPLDATFTTDILVANKNSLLIEITLFLSVLSPGFFVFCYLGIVPTKCKNAFSDPLGRRADITGRPVLIK